MLDFIIRMYDMGRYTLDQVKAVMMKYRLTELVDVVLCEDSTTKFVSTDYSLQDGETYIDKTVFFK